MKVYKLSKLILCFMLAALAFLTFIGAALGIRWVAVAGAPRPLQVFFLLWLGILAWIWYVYLNIPVEIRLGDNGALEFRTLIRSTTVPVRGIVSIKAVPLSPGFLKVKHRGGTIRLLSQMTGLYELIGTVKAINPEVEIKGC